MFRSKKVKQAPEPPKKQEVVLPKQQEKELLRDKDNPPGTHVYEQMIRKLYDQVEATLENSAYANTTSEGVLKYELFPKK